MGISSSNKENKQGRFRERDYKGRKFGLTVYACLLLPALLYGGYIDGNHFVTCFPLVLGLYFTGNVAQKRWESNTYGSYSEYDDSGRYGSRRGYDSDVQVSESVDSVQYGGSDGVHRQRVGRYDPNPDI